MSSVTKFRKSSEASKAVFEQVDADGSGKIDRAELKRAMVMVAQEAGIPAPGDEQVEAAMKALDTDRSGTLDLSEFQVLIEEILRALASL